MIVEALQHCTGIGPVRLAQLHRAGIRSWYDALNSPERIPFGYRRDLIQECQRCLSALESQNIRYFVDHFVAQDKWRIAAHFLDQTSFFDIETMGLDYHSPITVIVCWHKGQLLWFVEHENLDDFLDVLDDVCLLASFNGSSFDVPRVLDSFHIPSLPCPHVDLRWLCFHQGLNGGLKDITRRMGINRPPDLEDADGALAVRLWSRWTVLHDSSARDQLIRYCAADVLLLTMLAERLVGRASNSHDIWNHLPSGLTPQSENEANETANSIRGQAFGVGSPKRLRVRGRRLAS